MLDSAVTDLVATGHTSCGNMIEPMRVERTCELLHRGMEGFRMSGRSIHIKVDGRTDSGTFVVDRKVLTVTTTYGRKAAAISPRVAHEALAHQLLQTRPLALGHSSAKKSLPLRPPYEDQLSELKLPIPAGLEVAMYVVIRKFNRMRSVAEAARRAESGLGQMLKQTPGFQGYCVFDAGQGVGGSISLFENREAAFAANEKALAWIRASLTDVSMASLKSPWVRFWPP